MDAKNESEKVGSGADTAKGPGSAGLPEVDSPNLAPSQGASGNVAASAGPVASSAEHKVTTAVALFKGEGIDPAPDNNDEPWWMRRLMTRIPPIAAAVVLSVTIGGLAGLYGAFGSKQQTDGAQVAQAGAVNETIARLAAEIAALKAAQETAAKTASTQLTRMSERIERAERAQAEPAKRLSALSETVDRLEHRVTASAPLTTAASPAPAAATASIAAGQADVTGTIPNSASSSTKDLSRLPVIPGWTLQRVQEGTAYISSREGMIEVGVGNALPGGGRVEAIRRQDGRWIVVTSRGLVVMR